MNTLKLNSAGLNRVTLNTIGEVRLVSKPPIPTYTLSASVVNGVVSATLNGVAVPLPYTAKEGDVIVVSVTPTDGYTFEGWSDGNTDNPRTITMSEDVDLSAECVEDVPSYENGVYIQHIDGKLYTTEEWTAEAFANEVANGVAVVDSSASFVIAKVSDKAMNQKWSSDAAILYEDVTTADAAVGAREDYKGKENTKAIVTHSTDGAANFCASYRFPNGAEGYLASIGEWIIAMNYRVDVDAAMAAIGESNVGWYYWSSTQANAEQAWRVRFADSNILKSTKPTTASALPFTTL